MIVISSCCIFFSIYVIIIIIFIIILFLFMYRQVQFIANANTFLQGDVLFPIINSICQLHVKMFCVLKKMSTISKHFFFFFCKICLTWSSAYCPSPSVKPVTQTVCSVDFVPETVNPKPPWCNRWTCSVYGSYSPIKFQARKQAQSLTFIKVLFHFLHSCICSELFWNSTLFNIIIYYS